MSQKNKEVYALKYQRTEYAKKIRKDYEAGKIKERRCNMRESGLSEMTAMQIHLQQY